MPFHVYILKSLSSGKLYTGQTSDLSKRLHSHNYGLSPYTKGRGPWQLLYSEEFETRSMAIKREKFLKSGKGREFIKEVLNQSD